MGEKKAEELTLSKRLVTEDMIHQFPDQVRSSVQHPTLNIQQFQQLFDADAWAAVTQMSMFTRGLLKEMMLNMIVLGS